MYKTRIIQDVFAIIGHTLLVGVILVMLIALLAGYSHLNTDRVPSFIKDNAVSAYLSPTLDKLSGKHINKDLSAMYGGVNSDYDTTTTTAKIVMPDGKQYSSIQTKAVD
jgi:di/tricarboxylate transporter